eukprot:1606427-Heterocapsa_arctica.AAC.1
MVPAFSTTVWTVMSGLHFWRTRAFVGKMKKWRELGPQSPAWGPADDKEQAAEGKSLSEESEDSSLLL